MKLRTIKLFVMLMVSVLVLASCSEADGTVEEFQNWKATNDSYFASKYAAVKDSIDKGDTSWKIIHTYAFAESLRNDVTDNILVKVLQEGTGSGCPMSTDSVLVDYRGYLLKSTSYTSPYDAELGYIFDQSWSGAYDKSTMRPSSFTVNGVIEGFSTALQYMHIGDRWKVYIPYNLGYGSTATDEIPAYSVLVFDITLDGYSRPGTALPVVYVKQNRLLNE